jgi:hypothetical protein
MTEELKKKVAFCIPTITKPYQVCLDSIKASLPLIEKAGWEHVMVSEIGCPYISAARSKMLRKALDAKATDIVFIDHDLSWEPKDLLALLETKGEVVAGTYRYKKEEEEYMGCVLSGADERPIVRDDGCISSFCIPAGFLKVTKSAINTFIEKYPELCYGDRHSPHVDLFNHGAYGHVWFGEDYAFSRNWLATGNPIWLIPNLNLDHHTATETFKGNYHEYLLREPGGSESEFPEVPKIRAIK